jgi:hypothetical protein
MTGIPPAAQPADAPTAMPRILGQAENAHGALMARELSRSNTTFPQWVALTLTAGATRIDRAELITRISGALKLPARQAAQTLDELIAREFLAPAPGAPSSLELTPAGQSHYAPLRAAIAQVTTCLYADIPAADLATTARVLTLLTTRANTALANTP